VRAAIGAVPSKEAERWKVKFTTAKNEHGLAFNLFGNPTWRDVLLEISGRRYSGPGNPHEVG